MDMCSVWWHTEHVKLPLVSESSFFVSLMCPWCWSTPEPVAVRTLRSGDAYLKPPSPVTSGFSLQLERLQCAFIPVTSNCSIRLVRGRVSGAADPAGWPRLPSHLQHSPAHSGGSRGVQSTRGLLSIGRAWKTSNCSSPAYLFAAALIGSEGKRLQNTV